MTMDRIEVTTSVQRRRRWTAAEKGRLVAASLERGAAVSAIAREARIRPSQLYGWRPQLRSSLPATAGFAAVRVAGEGPATPGLSVAPGMIEIEFATGTQMVFRARENSFEPYLQWLDAQWAAGLRNGAELWRRLRCKGSADRCGVVTEWATRRRKAERAEAQSLRQIPSARSIARLLTISRDTLSKSETISVAAIENQVPLLVEVREIVAAFHDMILIASSFDQDPQAGPSSWLGPYIVGRPNEVPEPM